jgi:hypothetical protein
MACLRIYHITLNQRHCILEGRPWYTTLWLPVGISERVLLLSIIFQVSTGTLGFHTLLKVYSTQSSFESTSTPFP